VGLVRVHSLISAFNQGPQRNVWRLMLAPDLGSNGAFQEVWPSKIRFMPQFCKFSGMWRKKTVLGNRSKTPYSHLRKDVG
ncbi:hypothetical protein, partial [Tritonibacter sp. SIMBA_163]|uniref:hypothetical protein n=1 Tax=Tritonibacter sp. SIMBA_163 TaxID=3080868 RepID=UPI00397E9F1D